MFSMRTLCVRLRLGRLVVGRITEFLLVDPPQPWRRISRIQGCGIVPNWLARRIHEVEEAPPIDSVVQAGGDAAAILFDHPQAAEDPEGSLLLVAAHGRLRFQLGLRLPDPRAVSGL